MRGLLRFAAWIVIVSVVGTADRVRAAEDSEGAQLRELREQIFEARERVGEHEREEREIFGRLEELDQRVDRLSSQLADAQREVDRARKALAEIAAREAIASTRLDKTRLAMRRRAVALYKTGGVGPLRLLFSADSLPGLFARASVLRKLLDYDAALVVRFRRESEAVQSARREEIRRTRVAEQAAQQHEARRAAYRSERAKKGELLARVRKDRTLERAVLVELERAARALEEKIVSLGESSPVDVASLDTRHFVSLRGSLPHPVHGVVSSFFGRVVDEEYGTETFNKGVEFEVERGDWVRAVASGEVRYAGWFRGYGKIVILDHGGQYFTVSGHLEKLSVEPGQTVDRGDAIATTGETGSLSGPSFYFEVRQGGEPLDPMQWLE